MKCTRLLLIGAIALLLVRPGWAVAQTSTPTSGYQIMFASAKDSQIYVMDSDGANRRKISTDDKLTYMNPQASPDGKHVAFEALTTEKPTTHLYVMDVDGSHVTQLTESSDTLAPTWSPNGKYIAYWFTVGGSTEIYVMNADGSRQHQLTKNAGSGKPTWSPDGKRIVFVGGVPFRGNAIFSINLDGSGLVQLTAEDLYEKTDPAWSLDGKHIAFAWTNNDTENIYVMNADGSNLTQLTHLIYASCPAWLPDGKYLTFVSRGKKPAEMFRIDVSGADMAKLTDLTDWEGSTSCPSWLKTPSTTGIETPATKSP